MRLLQSISNRLRNLFRKDAVELETDQELRFHLERQIAVYTAAGVSPEEARRAALPEFGGLEQFMDGHPDFRRRQLGFRDSGRIHNAAAARGARCRLSSRAPRDGHRSDGFAAL
jgi:hypothetical protein